jgi:hypothetical protein
MKYRLIFGCLGSVLASSPAHAIDLDISGFGSFIGGYSEKGNGYLQYAQDDLDYQPDSLAGLQVSGRINDKATATVQIISRAMENWGTSADWAYVTYQPRSDFTWKMGRYRGPFFLYSENILVGYTYPWISPPYSAYNVPFTSVDGVSLTYSRSVNDIDLEFQGYTGNSHFNGESGVLEGIEGDARNIVGFVSQATIDDWVARLAIHSTKLTFDLSGSSQGAAFNALEQSLRAAGYTDVADDLRIEDDRVTYADAAIQYDNGRFLGIVESTYFSSHNTTPIGALTTYYVTAGIRDNSLLYHLTYGRSDGDEADITGNLPPDSLSYALVHLATYAFLPQDDTWTAGVRWDFAEGMAFKLEATHIPEYHPRVVDIDDEYSMTIVRLGVQTIF